LFSIKSCFFFQLDPHGSVPAVSLGTRSGQIVSARYADKVKKIFGIAQQRVRILLDNRVCFKPFLSAAALWQADAC
jgi:hypothetical protein